MHVFETKHHTHLFIHTIIIEHMQTYTEQKKLQYTLFIILPELKQSFLHAVYSLGRLTFHKHFSLTNYTKH
jgi:hypothetical protein